MTHCNNKINYLKNWTPPQPRKVYIKECPTCDKLPVLIGNYLFTFRKTNISLISQNVNDYYIMDLNLDFSPSPLIGGNITLYIPDYNIYWQKNKNIGEINLPLSSTNLFAYQIYIGVDVTSIYILQIYSNNKLLFEDIMTNINAYVGKYLVSFCSDLKLKGCSSYNFKIKCKDKFIINPLLYISISNNMTILPTACDQ